MKRLIEHSNDLLEVSHRKEQNMSKP